MSKEKKIVRWVMPQDGMAKFEDDPTPYNLSDKVVNLDFEKIGIVKGAEVEVEIKDDEVVFISLVKGVKEEVKKEDNSSDNESDLEVLTKTIAGVSKNTRGVIFKEDEDNKVWYRIGKQINLDNELLVKDNRVTIKVQKSKKEGLNDIIVEIEQAKVEEKDNNKSEEKPRNSYGSEQTSRQNSIEAQAAVNHANITVATLLAGKVDPSNAEDGKTVLGLIQVIAKKNFELIQELKN